MRRDVFRAIADPTRREIIHMIARRELNVNAVSGHFDISRPAVYKHMKILAECGLVVLKQKGREKVCKAKLERLNEVSDWVEQYREFWSTKLDALEAYLEQLQTGEKKMSKNKTKKHGKSERKKRNKRS